jgi:hybrid polyketide synthase/nonribosomal peptide synthetase ACE1
VLLETAKGALSHAVVTLRSSGEDRFLVAHVVFAPDFPSHRRQQMINRLESALPLPSCMQPTLIVPLESIPVTTNFKVNRKVVEVLFLPEAGAGGTENLANMETKVAELWKAIALHVVRDLVPESDFFDIGGNSILLVKLQAATKRELQSAPRLIDLINVSTLEGMARHVRAHQVKISTGRRKQKSQRH